MTGEGFPVRDGARQIFEFHFGQLLSPEDFERTKLVFDDLGAFNERGLAIQLHMAASLGKLPEVLAEYEKLMAPDSYLARVPDQITRALEVRLFKDQVYMHVICEGDPMKIILSGGLPTYPPEFELMYEEEPFLN